MKDAGGGWGGRKRDPARGRGGWVGVGEVLRGWGAGGL